MGRSFKQALGVVVILLFTVSLLASCGGNTKENAQTGASTSDSGAAGDQENGLSKEPVTISLYIGEPWTAGIVDPSWTDPVAKKLTEKTGVTLDVSLVKSQDADSEINIRMASDDLPDLILKAGEARKKLIDGGYVQPLDNLIEQYGPNIKKNLGVFFGNWRERDGHIYGLGSWCWNKPSKYTLNLQVNTLHMRYDILKELGYSKLDRKNDLDSFITMDEYMNLLQQVRNKYPDMHATLIDTDNSSIWNAYDILLKSKGVKVFGDAVYEDGKVKYKYNSKYTLDIIKYLNKLNNDGYFPKGMATFKLEQNQNLIATGQVFSTIGMVNGLSEAQFALSEGNDEKRMVMFYLTDNSGIKTLAINGTQNIGGPALQVSSKAKNIDRIMQFLDFCASDEGSFIICAGVEGITYTKAADGSIQPMEEMYNGYVNWDANVLKKFGVGAWECVLPSLGGLDEKGEPFDIFAKKTLDENKWALYNNSDWERISFINPMSVTAEMDKATYPEGFEASSKIDSYIKDRTIKAIFQTTQEKCEEEWKKTLEQMKADGLDAFEKALESYWNELAKAMGTTPDKLITVSIEK